MSDLPAAVSDISAEDVVHFWRQAGPAAWFAKNEAFDADFKARFFGSYQDARLGRLKDWEVSPVGVLALMILLDQFPRNSFRGTARMYEADEQAIGVARKAIEAGLDQLIEPDLRLFFYLPFEHAENLEDQELAVRLVEPLGPELLRYAEIHRDVIKEFGRFPHRNKILGRQSTDSEIAFLDSGGFAG